MKIANKIFRFVGSASGIAINLLTRAGKEVKDGVRSGFEEKKLVICIWCKDKTNLKEAVKVQDKFTLCPYCTESLGAAYAAMDGHTGGTRGPIDEKTQEKVVNAMLSDVHEEGKPNGLNDFIHEANYWYEQLYGDD